MSWSVSKDTTDCMAERELEKLVRPDAKRVKGMAGVGSGPLSLGAS